MLVSRIKSIDVFENSLEVAKSGDSVTIVLEDDIDVSRGNMIVPSDNLPEVTKDINVIVITSYSIHYTKLYDSNLKFVEGTIEEYECAELDVMIALHACNTATDDAIAKAINADAGLIVVAPCCQHQIRQEIEKSQKENTLSPVIKHGIFLERQAELITDGIRALVMEYYGYKTKVVEFISDAHTHKNIMIIGQKTTKKDKNPEVLRKIDDIKEMFGIEEHYLLKILGLQNKK